MIPHRCKCSGRLDASTPQQIMDDMEIDVFGEIITLTRSESPFLELYKAALWQKYRYRYIANCDLEYWEQIFADKMNLVIGKYDAFMSKFNATDLTDLEAASGTSKTKRTPITGTDGDVTHTEHQTYPITPVDPTKKYLTDSNDVKFKPNTQDETEYHDFADLNSTTFKAMMDDYESPINRFVEEFDSMFLNRW